MSAARILVAHLVRAHGFAGEEFSPCMFQVVPISFINDLLDLILMNVFPGLYYDDVSLGNPMLFSRAL